MTSTTSMLQRIAAIAMSIAMALTLTVSAFALDPQPYNASETTILARVNATSKTYSVTVNAPTGTTKIEVQATLYQKQLIGRKEISSLSGSVNGRVYTKSKSAAIESGKTYVVEVTATIYSGSVKDTLKDTITVKT